MTLSKDMGWRDPVQLYRLRRAKQFWTIVGVIVFLLVLAVYWFLLRG